MLTPPLNRRQYIFWFWNGNRYAEPRISLYWRLRYGLLFGRTPLVITRARFHQIGSGAIEEALNPNIRDWWR